MSKKRRGATAHHSRRRRPRRFRWKLLLATLVCLALAGWGLSEWRQWQFARLARGYLQQAQAAADEQQWALILRRYQPFLRTMPDNAQAQALLGRALLRLGRSAEQMQEAHRILALAHSSAPDQVDWLVDLIEYECRVAPASAAERLRQYPAVAANDRLLKLAAMAEDRLLQTMPTDYGQILVTVRALQRAQRQLPDDIELTVRLATLWRTHADRLAEDLNTKPLELRARADQLLDSLVGVQPEQPRAWMAHYAYRRQFADSQLTGDARSDLARVLELEPQDLEANLAMAQERLPELFAAEVFWKPDPSLVPRAERCREVQQCLLAAQAGAPHHWRPYLALGRLGWWAGDRAGAARVLELGNRQTAQQSVHLMSTAIQLMILDQQWPESRQAIDQALDRWRWADALGEGSAAQRADADAVWHILRGRWWSADGNPDRDLRQAHQVFRLATSLAQEVRLEVTAWEELAACCRQLGLVREAEQAQRRVERLRVGTEVPEEAVSP